MVIKKARKSYDLKTDNVEKQNENNDEVDAERPNWSNGVEFLMSCISMSVGLGNIWRFPFTAYENGGGAFLIPYIIVLFLIGKPMYYLEMILGQFTSQGSVKIWSICPLFLGVGYGQAFATICIITYYSSLLALTLYYFGVSFQAVLPWSFCRPEWGDNCVDATPTFNETQSNDIAPFGQQLQSSSELYFLKVVTNELTDISDGLGMPSWQLSLTLFISWAVIFILIMRGVKSSGKAAYFLALFPYVILVALLIKAATLEGAVDGIIFFLKPNWIELINPKVWKEAVVQCFFSLAVGIGPLIMFSSYNRFDHSVYRDTMIVTSLDTATSLLAGITIFGILGNLAHNLKITEISEVIKSGTGLAFISYPDAIAKFQALPQFFAVMFFFMLFVLGLGSIVALQSTIVTIICDQFKSLQTWKVALFTTIAGFLMSLVYVTPGGQWILNLVDFYGGTYVVFVLAILEMIGIFWIYGLQNFCDDVNFMTGRKVTIYWRICWVFFTPILMLIIFIYSMCTIEPIKYSGYFYPESANITGWLLFMIGVAQFPVWAVWYLCTENKDQNFLTRMRNSLKPDSHWGPKNPTKRIQWVAFKTELAEQRAKAAASNKLNFFWQKFNKIFGSTN